MLTLIGNTTLSSDQLGKFGGLRMWAERGLIHIEDAKDNSYRAISVDVAKERLLGLVDMLDNSNSKRKKHSHDQFDMQRIRSIQNMVSNMTAVIRKAQEQGMPTDASARRDLVRRRPKTVVVSDAVNF